MFRNLNDFLRGARGSSQTRLVVLVTAALTVIGVMIFAAQPWGGNSAQAEDPPRICDFFPDYFLCATQTPTQTWTPSNTPTITNTPTDTLTPTNTLTPTLTPTFIPKLTSTAPPKAIIGGGTGGATVSTNGTRYVPMFDTGAFSTLSDAQQALPSHGTVTHFFVRWDGAPGGNGSYLAQLNIGGGPTDLSCQTDDPNSSCSDRSQCAEVSKEELIAVAVFGKGATVSRAMSWTAIFTPNASCPGN